MSLPPPQMPKTITKIMYVWRYAPKVGIPISFWEPNMMMDVTRSAYCLMGLGGISIRNETIYNRGALVAQRKQAPQNSFLSRACLSLSRHSLVRNTHGLPLPRSLVG